MILADVSDPDAALSSIAAITADQGLTFTTETYEGRGAAGRRGDGVCGRRWDARRRQRGRRDPRRGRHEWRWRLARRPAGLHRRDGRAAERLPGLVLRRPRRLGGGVRRDRRPREHHDRQRRPRRRARWPEAERQRAALRGLGRRSFRRTGGGGAGHPLGLDAGSGPWPRSPSSACASALEAGLAVAGDVPEGEEVTSALDTLRALGRIRVRGRPGRRRAAAPRRGDRTRRSAASVRTACRRASSCSVPPIRTLPSASSDAIADRIGSSGGSSSTETLDGIDITTISMPGHGRGGIRRGRRGRRHRPERRRTSPPLPSRAAADSPSTGRAPTSRRSTSRACGRGPRSSSTSGRSAGC